MRETDDAVVMGGVEGCGCSCSGRAGGGERGRGLMFEVVRSLHWRRGEESGAAQGSQPAKERASERLEEGRHSGQGREGGREGRGVEAGHGTPGLALLPRLRRSLTGWLYRNLSRGGRGSGECALPWYAQC